MAPLALSVPHIKEGASGLRDEATDFVGWLAVANMGAHATRIAGHISMKMGLESGAGLARLHRDMGHRVVVGGA